MPTSLAPSSSSITERTACPREVKRKKTKRPAKMRSEEHTSELQSRYISYAVFCLKKKRDLDTHAKDVSSTAGPCAASPPTLARRARPRRGRPQPRWGVRASALRRHFFFNDTATTEIYTLSLHDALPI